MPVRQSITWETIDGRPFTSIEEWLETLPKEEQDEYWAARERQDQYRQEAIDSGLMIRDPETGDYVWRDDDALETNKGSDLVWHQYWMRWLDECGINCKIEYIDE